jgi:predicted RNA-binding Zn-ribbon protein involved in translation (DUF1610 family)
VTRHPKLVEFVCPKCGHTIKTVVTAVVTCRASLRCERRGTRMMAVWPEGDEE